MAATRAPDGIDDVIDLPPGVELPAPIGEPTGEDHRRVVTWFDTAEDDLRRAGTTLRREQRVDGSGWTLQFPDEEPLVRPDSPTVPGPFAELLWGQRRGRRLRPVMRETVHTRPRLAPDATTVVEETVEAGALGLHDVTIETWRRVRLSGHGPARTAVRKALLRTKVGGRSARTGDLDRVRPLIPVPPARTVGTAGDLIAAYIAEQCRVIIRSAPALRRGHDVVHRTRVATRRLRSTLRVFASFFPPQATSAFDAELAWYAGLLGAVRDPEVVRAHLARQVDDLPPELVLGPVSARIGETLDADVARGRATRGSALRGSRYRGLIDEVALWSLAPPMLDRADGPSSLLVKPVVAARRRLVRRLAAGVADVHHDETLHRARKAGKRLRYAVELAAPALSNKQRRDQRRAEAVQTVLGEHQDAVVTADLLRRLGADAGRTGENGFTFGLLLAQEHERAERSRARAGDLVARHWT